MTVRKNGFSAGHGVFHDSPSAQEARMGAGSVCGSEGAAMPLQAPEKTDAAIRAALTALLAEQVRRYTAGESSSVSVAVARELLEGIRYLVGLELEARGLPFSALAASDFDGWSALEAGRARARQIAQHARLLYSAACRTAPDLGCLALRDTLRSIGTFFKRYDTLYFAHDIPCSIDYPLAQSVPQTLCGASYLDAYLRGVCLENALLCRFPAEREARLLSRIHPDWRGLILNLYEPVLLNAAALALLEEPPASLGVAPEQRARLAALLASMPPEQGRAALGAAARLSCERMGVQSEAAGRYALQTAEAQWPRVAAALASGSLEAVFLPLGGHETFAASGCSDGMRSAAEKEEETPLAFS